MSAAIEAATQLAGKYSPAEEEHLAHYKQGVIDHEIHQAVHARDYAIGVFDAKLHKAEQDPPHGTLNHGFLSERDPVGISFWIISIAMVASTTFFLMESLCLKVHWKTSMHVGALVTLVAAVHYWYMREYWVTMGSSPIVYRYIDWTITVPLQMIEFFLILSAVSPNVSGGMFWRLMVGTVLMLLFGYAGESKAIDPLMGFVLGMCGWGFILAEIFVGEASRVAVEADKSNRFIKSAYNTMRLIVTVGWSIYPLGYFFGYLVGAVDEKLLNAIYNLADFVNKIAFCLAIWHAGKRDTLASERH